MAVACSGEEAEGSALQDLPRGCDDNAIFMVLDSIAMYIGTVAKVPRSYCLSIRV